MADVDHFKAYNDTYGHQQGDECLKLVAGTMQSALSRAGDMLARYGGEEFAVILPSTDVAGAFEVAERILNAVSSMRLEHGGSSVADHVTISMGVSALRPDEQSSVQELIETADKNLYTAKAQGRNRVFGL